MPMMTTTQARSSNLAGKLAETPQADYDVSIPEAILPEQYFDRVAARASETPERRLMFAVLLDALIQLQRRNSVGAAEAERWIRSEEQWPFSFQNVCEALGIESSYLARGLLAWCESSQAALLGIPARQLRTTHSRVTPIRRRRRRPRRPAASPSRRCASAR